MATKKYMSVAGQSFYNTDADKYYKDIFKGQVLDAVINDKSFFDVTWNMYNYGADQYNRYYSIGTTEFSDRLPSVRLTGIRIDPNAFKNVLEADLGITIDAIPNSTYGTFAPIASEFVETRTTVSSVEPYDIKFTMGDARWNLWTYYIRYVLQTAYSYNHSKGTYIRNGQTYKVDWGLTGDPLGIDYSLGDGALDNTNYTANEAQYKSSPFIVANEYHEERETVEERTEIIIFNLNDETDLKRVIVSHIITVYDSFGTEIGVTIQNISDTLYEVPIGSENPSDTTILISDREYSVLGNQVTWFLGSLPTVVRVRVEWTSTMGGQLPVTYTTPVYYYFATYEVNGESKVWYKEAQYVNLPEPVVQKTNEGDPYNTLSVMPVATLMNNDRVLSESNNPDRYKSTNRLLSVLNLNVDTLNATLQTKEAPIQSNDALHLWMAKFFTTETLENVFSLNPNYVANYDPANYPKDGINREDKYLLNPSINHIQNIINNALGKLSIAEADEIIGRMLDSLAKIHRVSGDGTHDCAYDPRLSWDSNRDVWIGGYPCSPTINNPDIKPWEDAFNLGMLRWLSNQLHITTQKVTEVTLLPNPNPEAGESDTYSRIITSYRFIKYDINGNEISRRTVVLSDITHPANMHINPSTITLSDPYDKKTLTATDRVPDSLLVLKRMNVYARDISTIYDRIEDDVEDSFVVIGVNPIATAFANDYDWTLPDLAKASEVKAYNDRVASNYKKKGVEVVSKVLFKYFNEIYTSMNLQESTTNSTIQMDIEEAPYFMHWSWVPKGKAVQTVQGNIMPKGRYMHTVRWFNKVYNTVDPIEGISSTIRNRDWSLEIWMYYQETDTTYKLINVTDLNIWYESRRHGKTCRVPQRDEDPTKDTSANRACLLPLPLIALRTLSLTEKAELFPYSLHMVIFAVKVVKTKWYQSGFFGILLNLLFIAVIIVLAIIPSTQPLAATLAVAYAKSLAIQIGMQFVMQLIRLSNLKAGQKAAIITVLAVVSVAVGGGFNIANPLEIMTTALNVLNLTINAVSMYYGFKTEELSVKSQELRNKYDRKSKELDEQASKFRSALLRRQMLLESYDDRRDSDNDLLLMPMSPSFRMYLYKEAYLNFDLCLEGNMDSISNYVDSKKQLRIDIEG